MFASDWGILTNGRGLFARLSHVLPARARHVVCPAPVQKGRTGPCALPYLSGIQYVQDGKVGFNGPLNTFVEPKSSNYYMEAWFGEQTLTGRINTIAIVLMVVMLGGSALMLKLIFALIAVAVAVPAGGLLAGVDRRLTARLQSRQGAAAAPALLRRPEALRESPLRDQPVAHLLVLRLSHGLRPLPCSCSSCRATCCCCSSS